MLNFWPFHRHHFVNDQRTEVLEASVFEQQIPEWELTRVWTCYECDGNVCQVGPEKHPEGKWARKHEKVGTVTQRIRQETVQRVAECACGQTQPSGQPFPRRVPVKEAVHG